MWRSSSSRSSRAAPRGCAAPWRPPTSTTLRWTATSTIPRAPRRSSRRPASIRRRSRSPSTRRRAAIRSTRTSRWPSPRSCSVSGSRPTSSSTSGAPTWTRSRTATPATCSSGAGAGPARPGHHAAAVPRRPDVLVLRQQQDHRRQDRARPDAARSQGARRGVCRAAAPGPRRGAVGLPLAAARHLRRGPVGGLDAARGREGLDVRRQGDRAMSLTVFTNAFLIDCTGAEPVEGATVIVEDDRIKDVRVKGGAGTLPGPVTTIDCGGATLMPGLTDAHVHICAVTENITDQHRFYPPSYIAARAMQRAHECLMQGFTTVRDAGGADYGFRMVLEEGHFPGPRLLVSGRYISQTGGHWDKRRRSEWTDPIDCCVGMVGFIADG